MQFLDLGAPRQTHAGTDTANQLGQLICQRAFVGDHPLDALRYELRILPVLLEIPVARAFGFLHGADRSHAAVGLEGSTLVENLLTGRFFHTSEERSDHHHVRTGRQGLRDVAGKADTPISNHRHTVFPGRPGARHDGSNLRHSRPGHDPSRADGSRANSHFERVGAKLDEISSCLFRSDVPDNQRGLRKFLLDLGRRIHHALGMSMRAVETQHVDVPFDEGRTPF